mmetsp:Transcript_20936/g.29550  ORF Transcript_20936/g.29550 Transcript_20936/m.29550 type:complete len:506 (-) Transcript_20936:80-1597(-)
MGSTSMTITPLFRNNYYAVAILLLLSLSSFTNAFTFVRKNHLLVQRNHQQTQRLQSRELHMQQQHQDEESIKMTEEQSHLPQEKYYASLAGPLVVDIQSSDVWTLIPIANVNGVSNDMPVGTQAMKALQTKHNGNDGVDEPEGNAKSITLKCHSENESCNDNNDDDKGVCRHIIISMTATPTMTNDEIEYYSDVIGVLSRIMIQRYETEQEEGKDTDVPTMYKITVPYFDEETEVMTETTLELNSLSNHEDIYKLFFDFDETVELVDMVATTGNDGSGGDTHVVLGSVPRPLVHGFNLLHRGIGVVVTRGTPIDEETKKDTAATTDLPDLYTHRRTSTKRIFPSLYDMFVGGVSGTQEDATVTVIRELEEELGLSNEQQLSSKLFDCTVCTSYNRCVVAVFCYTCEKEEESKIQWQKEEVAWGDFVPYSTIEQAAQLSINRLKQVGEWPGTYPQDDNNNEDENSSAGVVASSDTHNDNDDWKQWDFVPDGLLVWNAWIEWYHNNN